MDANRPLIDKVGEVDAIEDSFSSILDSFCSCAGTDASFFYFNELVYLLKELEGSVSDEQVMWLLAPAEVYLALLCNV